MKTAPPLSFRIVSRASQLARIQVQEALSCTGLTASETLWVESYGDLHQEQSLLEGVAQDFFTRELDQALLHGNADVAVHSAKDLPYPLPEGLVVAALLPATDQRDALAGKHHMKLADLPAGSRVGTSSPQRKHQLGMLRPDLKNLSIRGTIEERLRQMDEGAYDAVVVAACALQRLGLSHRISDFLPLETHPLQGHLALVTRAEELEIIQLLQPFDCRNHWGNVTLAGFGPGNPQYMTLLTHSALQKADAVFYDDLLDATALDQYPGQKIYVGKRKSQHAFSQEAIQEQLHQTARRGLHVVRLKGGDPLIFGRGIEEYHYLKARLVETSLIPGISSAQAAAAQALVPLTARGISSSVALLTGHDLDKLVVPKADTLVFYMGAAFQQELAHKLILEGWNSQTPVAVVQNASYSHAQIRRYTLESLHGARGVLESPAIILVGWSAATHTQSLPPRWLYTGSKVADCNESGMVIHSPLVHIHYPAPPDDAMALRQQIDTHQLLLFTSRYAVKGFFKTLFAAGLDSRALAHLQIEAIGVTTCAALAQNGIRLSPMSSNESSEGMLLEFASRNLPPVKILFPRSPIGLPVLPEGLRAMGHEITTMHVYENQMPQNPVKHDLSTFSGVVFTSPSTVNRFAQLYGGFPAHLHYRFKGSQTRKAFEQHRSQLP